MSKKQITNHKDITSSLLSSPKYRGKHLVIIKNKVFAANTGQEAAKIFKEVVKKYPQEKPTITYIPKEETLILFFIGYGN